MGKGLLIVVVGAILGASVLSMQQRETALETTKRQTSYEEEVLAREIARSAYGVAYRLAQSAGNDLDLAISNVNGTLQDGSPDVDGEMVGDYQGGDFVVQAYTIDGQNVKIRATGHFGEAEHVINENYKIRLLTVKQESRMTIEFIESMAGYCSAVFLERYIPNKGQGQPAGSQVTDDDRYFVLTPEMIFDSGHNRPVSESRTTPADIILQPGTRMNFFIGVDKNCSQEGQWHDDYDEDRYDYVHHALEESFDEVEDLQEGEYSMIEQHETNDQKWRIAFEDLRNFSTAQHEDIKANGYGGSWNSSAQTYGGDGWTSQDNLGYRQLQDYGSKPDFSDQVIEVTLNGCGGPCVPAS